MNKQILYILAFTVIYMCVWLGIFKHSYSDSRTRNKIALFISSHTPIPVNYSFSIFATIFYSGMPLLGAFLICKLFDIHLLQMFWDYQGRTFLFVDILMGLLAVMAVDSVPLVVLSVLNPNIRIDKEMQEVNWIAGISKIPGRWSMMIPFISACCEEVFFRGAVFAALIHANMPLWTASIIVTVLFVLNQIYLTKRSVQAFVLGSSSAAISIVSCLLIGITGNLIPSLVIHSSFAGFYANNQA